jgi:hypothetical protein
MGGFSVGTPQGERSATLGKRAAGGMERAGAQRRVRTSEPRNIGDNPCATRSGAECVLGKHSCRHALADGLGKLGHPLDRNELDEVYVRFAQLADRKKSIRPGLTRPPLARKPPGLIRRFVQGPVRYGSLNLGFAGLSRGSSFFPVGRAFYCALL